MIKKKTQKKNVAIDRFYPTKQFFFSLSLFFLGIYSIAFVQTTIQVNASKSAPIAEKKVTTLSATEPIHIGKGFVVKQHSEKPLRIIIPRLNIDLPIVEAKVIEDSWEISETAASHGEGSAYPGQKGNVVIFAHARVHLFLPLQDIQEFDEIYVLTDKSWYSYSVSKITEVLPDQVEVIHPTPDEQLTLFTCSGFADEKRLIVVGKREQKMAAN